MTAIHRLLLMREARRGKRVGNRKGQKNKRRSIYIVMFYVGASNSVPWWNVVVARTKREAKKLAWVVFPVHLKKEFRRDVVLAASWVRYIDEIPDESTVLS